MKKILFFLLLIASFAASAQTPWTWNPINNRERFTIGLGLPVKTLTTAFGKDSAQLWLNPGDSTLKYSYKGLIQTLLTNSSSFKNSSDSLFITGFTTRGRTKQLTDSMSATLGKLAATQTWSGVNTFGYIITAQISSSGNINAGGMTIAGNTGSTPGVGLFYEYVNSTTSRYWHVTNDNSNNINYAYSTDGLTYTNQVTISPTGLITAKSFSNTGNFTNTGTLNVTGQGNFNTYVNAPVFRGTQGLGPFELYNSAADQYYWANNALATSTGRKGVDLSDGSTIDFYFRIGGNNTLGSYTENINLLAIGALSGGGGNETILFHSSGKGNILAMEATNSLIRSYWPITTTARITAGNLSVTGNSSLNGTNILSAAGASALAVNSTNSYGFKMSFQDAGTVRGYLGASSTSSLIIGDAAANTIASFGTLGTAATATFGAATGTIRVGTNGSDYATFNYSGGGTSVRNDWANTSAYVDILANSVGVRVNGASQVFNAANTTTFNTTSDIRIKDNVRNIDSATDVIMALRPVLYDYTKKFSDYKKMRDNNLKKNIPGFIAQQFETVFPSFVTTSNEDSLQITDLKSINTAPVLPYLVKAFQEMQNTINQLREDIDKLKDNPFAFKMGGSPTYFSLPTVTNNQPLNK